MKINIYTIILSSLVSIFIMSCSAEQEGTAAYTDFDYQVVEEGYKVEFIGAPYTIPIDNCDNARDSTKQEERSKTYLAELDITISNEVAGEFGGDVKVARAVLSEKIGTALHIKIGAEAVSKSSVEIVTPAGKRNNTEVQWKETWTEGSIAIIRPNGSYVGVVPFVVLNSLVLEQLSSQTLDCETGNIVSQETTPQALPTAVPQILPTPEPILIGTISVPANTNEGVRFTANQAGKYVFKYIGGAYSTYALDKIPEGTKTWLTAVRVFKNAPSQWNGDAISNSPDLNAVDYGYSFSSEEAQLKAQGSSSTISLLRGEYLTLVTVDGRPYYSDNPGEVVFEVLFTPPQ